MGENVGTSVNGIKIPTLVRNELFERYIIKYSLP